MPVTLADQALETAAGERLQARCMSRAVLVALANGDGDAEREIAAGMLEAPDGGEGLALAQYRELPDDQRERLALWARDNARRRCQFAADELIAAALDLGGDGEVEPEAVALPLCAEKKPTLELVFSGRAAAYDS